MSVSFEVVRVGDDGRQELIHTTQSAREARLMRDADPGQLLVFVHDDGLLSDGRERFADVDTRGDAGRL